MKKLIEYTKSVLAAIGLKADENGFIVNVNDKAIMIGDLRVALPTMDNINNMNRVDEITNKLVRNYILYNPYDDDVIKRNNILTFTMRYAGRFASTSIYGVMTQLVAILADDALIEDSSVVTQKFAMGLSMKLGKRGKLVTTKTASAIDKMFSWLIANNKSIIKYRLCKGATIDGIKYNRVTKLDYSAMSDLEDKYESIGVSEREVTIFNEMLRFIIPDIESTVSGSKSGLYPSYISAMRIHTDISIRVNFLLEQYKNVNPRAYEVFTLPLIDDTDVEKLVKDIEFIPTNTATQNEHGEVSESTHPVVKSETIRDNSVAKYGANDVYIPKDDADAARFNKLRYIPATEQSGYHNANGAPVDMSRQQQSYTQAPQFSNGPQSQYNQQYNQQPYTQAPQFSNGPQSQYGQSHYSQPQYGQSQYGQSQYGQQQYGQQQYGQQQQQQQQRGQVVHSAWV